MASKRNQIIELIEQGHIPEENVIDALKLLKISPDGKSWQAFFDLLLVWIGGLAIAFSGLFFIAYNWDAMEALGKFALVEVAIILCIAGYWKLGQSTAAKVCLLMATIFLGVLLALYGQTYQTGADPWQLFFTWALLMLPWALIGRFAAIWLVWLLLLNLSLILYHQTFSHIFWLMFSSGIQLLWSIYLLNSIAFIAWQALANNRQWLQAAWAIRLLATVCGVTISWLVIYAIVEYKNAGIWPVLVWTLWMAGMYWFYRRIKPDLFMLTGLCMSGIVVIVTLQIRFLFFGSGAGNFLLYALMIIALGSGSALWLRKVHQELQS